MDVCTSGAWASQRIRREIALLALRYEAHVFSYLPLLRI
jgi:hypothetical protein